MTVPTRKDAKARAVVTYRTVSGHPATGTLLNVAGESLSSPCKVVTSSGAVIVRRRSELFVHNAAPRVVP